MLPVMTAAVTSTMACEVSAVSKVVARCKMTAVCKLPPMSEAMVEPEKERRRDDITIRVRVVVIIRVKVGIGWRIWRRGTLLFQPGGASHGKSQTEKQPSSRLCRRYKATKFHISAYR